MNILISGATGFIGSHLLRKLLHEGHTCRCLVRHTDSLDSIFHRNNIEIFEGDVIDLQSLNDIGKDIDVAYHLAGSGHVTSVLEKDYEQAFDINVRGTKNFAEACAHNGVKRLIHFSSTAAMGLIRLSTIDETTLCRPRSPYQRSKHESELVALEAGVRFGMEVIVFRPCMVYGPGGKGEFLKFCRLINRGIFPRIGLGKNLTPIVHVKDVIQAAVKALYKGRGGEVYLIASEKSPPLEEIHRFICDGLNIRRHYFYVPVWVAYVIAFFLERMSPLTGKEPVVSRTNVVSTVTGRVFDISKARKELSYQPQTDIKKGIGETVIWFKKEKLIP